MIRMIDLQDNMQVLELLLLQQMSYRVEAELVGFDETPPLWDTPQSIRESGERFFGWYAEESLLGAMAVKPSGNGELTISRLMVHPDHSRRGVAGHLLQHAEQEAALSGVRIKVAAGTKNEPAIRLYRKHGYQPYEEVEIAPGITLTLFAKG